MISRESQTVEFKESWRDEYLKTVCAFANTDGGTFYIGVNDKGEVVGIDKVKKLMDDLPNKVMNSFGLFVGIHIKENNGLPYIEGRGTLKMIENAREGGCTEPAFAEFQDSILVTFEKKEFGDTINDTIKAVDELILAQLTMNDGISAPEIAKRIDKPLSTVKRYLGQMKKAGRIEFIGALKTGDYHIKK
ncbi:MAG: putative DNA binding domain-containing protein [Odoribacter sp.]